MLKFLSLSFTWPHRQVALLGLALALLSSRASLAQQESSPLKPSEVAVVANYSFPYSVDLAKQYLAARGIPPKQLLVTGMPCEENVSRMDYERLIAGPIKDFLVGEKLDHVRCLVLMYGVPVKVLEPVASNEERRVEIMLREERPALLSELIGLIPRVQAIAAATSKPASLPPFDARANAASQIKRLSQQLLADFISSAERLGAMPRGDARQQAEAEWLKLWIKGFGFASPRNMEMIGAPENNVSNERQQGCALRITRLMGQGLTIDSTRELLKLVEESRGVSGVLDLCEVLLQRVKPDWSHRASVDSELCTLFWPSFPTSGPVPNPLNLHIRVENAPRTLMACRLDGPSEPIVRKMIETSVAVEKTGLAGKIYLDARGIAGDSGYATYDNDLRRLGTILDEFSKLTTVLDNKPGLFQRGQCPEAALYCGWYSLAKYVDAFSFVPGAVGYHLASSEAMALRKPGATTWCPQLLAHGAVATLGPVEEPYLTSFPPPAEFFSLLLTGQFPLGDCYFMTLPRLSWMMTLIGDPLYNPYAAKPAVEASLLTGILFEDSGASDPQ